LVNITKVTDIKIVSKKQQMGPCLNNNSYNFALLYHKKLMSEEEEQQLQYDTEFLPNTKDKSM